MTKYDGDPSQWPVDARTVTWAYRQLLGREPESAAVVQHTQRTHATLGSLVAAFLASPEFSARRQERTLPSLDGNEPPMSIAPVRSAADLQRLFAHIQATWQRLGETEPHWSVLTSADFKQENIATSRERFYETGRQNLDVLAASLQRCGIDPRRLTTGIEYGCGVGRFTQWLAGHMHTLHAYDISNAHLKLAREHLASRGTTNVEFHHVRTLADLDALPRVDLVYSCIVLQHNPPPIIELLMARLLGALAPKGVAYLQLPTYMRNYVFDLPSYLTHADRVREVEMHTITQRRAFEIVRDAACDVLEVLDDDTLTGLGRHNITNVFLVQKRG